MSVLADNSLTVAGPPNLHQFNPPWTTPVLERHEIVVEIALN